MIRNQPQSRGSEEGGVAVEAALSMTLLLLLILAVIEFAVALYERHTMLLAVSQAGRYVMVSYAPSNTVCDTACAKARMQTVLPTASASCANPSAPAAGQICVNATISGSNMTLTATYGFSFLSLVVPSIKLSAGIKVPLV